MVKIQAMPKKVNRCGCECGCGCGCLVATTMKKEEKKGVLHGFLPAYIAMNQVAE